MIKPEVSVSSYVERAVRRRNNNTIGSLKFTSEIDQKYKSPTKLKEYVEKLLTGTRDLQDRYNELSKDIPPISLEILPDEMIDSNALLYFSFPRIIKTLTTMKTLCGQEATTQNKKKFKQLLEAVILDEIDPKKSVSSPVGLRRLTQLLHEVVVENNQLGGSTDENVKRFVNQVKELNTRYNSPGIWYPCKLYDDISAALENSVTQGQYR